MDHMLLFRLDKQYFAFDLAAVERIIWAVKTTAVPQSSSNILGMMDFQGQIIPVLDARRLFGKTDREIELEDQFIICHAYARTLGLWVDHVEGVIHPAGEISEENLSGHDAIDQMINYQNQIVFVFNLEKLLSKTNLSGLTKMVSL